MGGRERSQRRGEERGEEEREGRKEGREVGREGRKRRDGALKIGGKMREEMRGGMEKMGNEERGKDEGEKRMEKDEI